MRALLLPVALCLVVSPVAAEEKPAPDPLASLLAEIDFETPHNMMNRYLLGQVEKAQVRWNKEYESRKTPEQISAYQKRLKQRFTEAIGGFPERTPLKARVVEKIERDGYRVEKVIYESQPRHFVSAALFLPDAKRHKPPYPGVLVPCGHSSNGKAMNVYQRVCALAALNGLAALIFDPVDQGERGQLLDEHGKPRLVGTRGHNMIGAGSILLGRNTARYEIWDGMRSIDYLQSRPEVDPERIGCTGNSGGGTQTSYFMALDERIDAAAPACYICGLFGRLLKQNGAQDAEQNIFVQLAFGMDHADYCMMRAPKPTLLCTATHDFFNIEDAWQSFRAAKRLYTRMGYGDRMCLVETDEKHGFSLRLREAAVRWMLRWLDGRDEAIFEPEDLTVLTDAEIQCTPRGQVMLLEGARSVYDLNRDYAAELAETRKKLWADTPRKEMLERVRKLAGIRALGELPQPKARKLKAIERNGYRIERLLLEPEAGIVLPALWMVPEGGGSKGAVLYLHQDGKHVDAAPGGPIEKLVLGGKVVLAVDLRGVGETQQKPQKYFTPSIHGKEGQDFYIAYHLARTYVGMRAEDVAVAARWLSQQPGWEKPAGLELVAVGHMTVPAVHAAALEPELFRKVRLVRPLVSWTNVVECGYAHTPFVSLVHAALLAYDLPDLAAVAGEKLQIVEPLDALGEPAEH